MEDGKKIRNKRLTLLIAVILAGAAVVIFLVRTASGKENDALPASGTKQTELTENAGPFAPDAKGTETVADAFNMDFGALNMVTAAPKTDISATEAEKEYDMPALQAELEQMIGGMDGEISVYVKIPDTKQEVVINDKSMYSASLIKLFVMEASFANMETLQEEGAACKGSAQAGKKYVDVLLRDMIERSDNDSYNQLVSMQTARMEFGDGCRFVLDYIQQNGYTETGIYHTLHPAESSYESIAEETDKTSVKDCGALLEKIYLGTCVSKEASACMLDMLLNQETTYKIPAGVPENIAVANKTGETDEAEHDAAIVYGDSTDYIICVMSRDSDSTEAEADNIAGISSAVYKHLN